MLLRACLLLLACLASAAAAAPQRELHAPADSLHTAELLALERLPGTDLALIMLAADGRQLSMFTGLNEAAAILRAREGERPARPQTHELLESALQSAGLEVRRVVVDRLDDAGNFHAAIELTDSAGASRWLDARPSDAIALALRAKAPLFVADQVLERAADDAANPARPALST